MMRPHYTQHDKQQYLLLCQCYNASQDPLNAESFLNLSLRLHSAKSTVPIKWRSARFIESQGKL